MRKYYLLLALLLIATIGFSQKSCNIKTNIPFAAGHFLVLQKFEGFYEILLDSGTVDSFGHAVLTYPSTYTGAAVLSVAGSSSMRILLDKEDFEIYWPTPESEGIIFTHSPQNTTFMFALNLNKQIKSRLAGLNYLLPLYEENSVESSWLENQINIQNQLLQDYIQKIPGDSYVKYYVGLSKIIAEMQESLNSGDVSRPEQMIAFKNLNLSDQRLLHSGLLGALLEDHFYLLETGDRDSIATYFDLSVDQILQQLKNNPELKQEVAEFLLRYFEKQSQYAAAGYLSQVMLEKGNTENSCRQIVFKQYLNMRVGKTAPEIIFEIDGQRKGCLSEMRSRYKLIVFGSSGCQQCIDEIPGLVAYYSEWCKIKMEVILVSLDIDSTAYNKFIKDFPWTNISDFKGWESKIVKDYHVTATPTMYLLDHNNKILLKPVSANQINTWLKLHAKI